jgi:hypothetical protein
MVQGYKGIEEDAVKGRGMGLEKAPGSGAGWPFVNGVDTIRRELRVEEGFNSLRVVRRFGSLPARC